MRWRAEFTVAGTGIEQIERSAEANAKTLAGPGVKIHLEYGMVQASEQITEGDGFQRVALWEVTVRATFDREDAEDV